MRTKLRDPYFDIIKAVAILMVVIQHCFLYFDGGLFESCLLNKMSSVVSVPLFMFISGYFNSFNKRGGIRKRFFSLMIPFLIWSYTYFFYESDFNFSLDAVISFTTNLITAPYYPSTMWFLRTLFLQILIVYGCTLITKKHLNLCLIGVYVVILLTSLFIIDKFAIKSLAGNLPYFLFGYWCKKYAIIGKRYFSIIGIISIPLFVVAILGREYFEPGMFLSILFKASSFLGIMSLLIIIKIVCRLCVGHTQVLERLGKETIYIYTTHFLVIWVLRDCGFSITSNFMYLNYLCYLLVSLIGTVILYRLLMKIRGVSWLLYAKK